MLVETSRETILFVEYLCQLEASDILELIREHCHSADEVFGPFRYILNDGEEFDEDDHRDQLIDYIASGLRGWFTDEPECILSDVSDLVQTDARQMVAYAMSTFVHAIDYRQAAEEWIMEKNLPADIFAAAI